MKRIFLILCLITICNISYADIASVGYVDGVAATKQDTISDIETIRTGAAAGATAVQPSSLSAVATSGSYNDLSNKPTLSTVATSGSYNDLSNKPTIPNIPTGPNDGKKYSLVWDGDGFVFEEFTTGGGSTPIDWDAIDAYLGGSSSSYAGYGLLIPYEYVDSYGYANLCDGTTSDYDHVFDCNDVLFTGMVAGDWYVNISEPINIKIKGRALCSSSNGTFAQPGDPEGSGVFNPDIAAGACWCKMTSPAESRWVFFADWGDMISCDAMCADKCALAVQDSDSEYSGFRSAMFGSVGQ